MLFLEPIRHILEPVVSMEPLAHDIHDVQLIGEQDSAL